MNNNQHKNKTSKTTSAGTNLLIIFLIAIIMVLSSLGMFAWAKYTTAANGSATAQVAKWSFKLVDGITETSDVIDFAFTRTDGYGKVAEGLLAPGTFGEFQIGLDARGTETILEYTIDVDLENKPTNLKLYSDSAKTQEISVTNNAFSINGSMDLQEVKEIKTVTVYWEWPYESGNDEADTKDAGKTTTMQVSVTGTEVLELAPEIISFTIEGKTYYAEKGMTWGDWLWSSYNTDKYWHMTGGAIVSPTTNTLYVATATGSGVNLNTILCEGEYHLEKATGTVEPD